MIFDTHAHFDDERYNDCLDTLMTQMHQNGVDSIINVGSNIETSYKSIEIAEKYDFVYAAVGVHPNDIEDMKEQDIDTLKKLSNHPKVVAIGEIGLDYYYKPYDKEKMQYWFKRQLEIAAELNLPVSVHSRDASQDTFDIIKASKVRKGVIHAYSGSVEMAKDYINMGFHIGVGGVVTFKNGRKLAEVVKNIPLKSILLETDSPYLSPVPLRGTVNNSQNIEYVAEKISELLDLPTEEIYKTTSQSAKELFF